MTEHIPAADDGSGIGTPSYRRRLLALLTVILAFNYLDRIVLGLLLQDIKADLKLSDSQLGFLGGIAFALFYSVLGIPIARWADRGHRVSAIAITCALWSAMVALCGAAGSFVQLALIRIGVAIGEAGCVPPAHSLIAESFRASERARAIGIYMLGGPLSMLIGYLVTGWLGETLGWRAVFVIFGLPGLLLALLAALFLREPATAPAAVTDACTTTASFSLRRGSELSQLLANRSFQHLIVSTSLVWLFGYGLLQWQPAFFIRTHGLSTALIGGWFAVVYGVGGLIGTYFGGDLAVRFKLSVASQLKTMAGSFILFGSLSAGVYLADDYRLAFALLGLSAIGIAATNGPLFATIQSIVPPRLRATAVAIVYMVANLIGMGLGPLLAGVASDLLRPALGEESLRYALLALCPGYFWAAWHIWRAGVTLGPPPSGATSPDTDPIKG